jgi:hypothetical protein
MAKRVTARWHRVAHAGTVGTLVRWDTLIGAMAKCA